MSLSEFEIISKYFERRPAQQSHVVVGVGDDAAVLHPPADQELVMTTDTLVTGVHFEHEVRPQDLGYKSLAVNISDLAAMGAQPRWALMALTIPTSDSGWLQAFASGFWELADTHEISLVGGDITRGPLSITIQLVGTVPAGQALRRDGAKPGDAIYVSGALGDAAAALQLRQGGASIKPGSMTYLCNRLDRPEPRVQLGLALREVASSAIDISDGLHGDLQHIVSRSRVGAEIDADRVPLSEALRENFSQTEAKHLALTGGDDYELCFTVPPERVATLLSTVGTSGCKITAIGEVTEEQGLRYRNLDLPAMGFAGYRHF